MGVLGIGGVFFRAKDPDALNEWYRDQLNVGAGCNPDAAGPVDQWSWTTIGGPTVFAPFKADTDYFPADKQYMLNFRKAFDEQNYGLPLKESLNNLAERIPSLDVRFFATAVLIQRETGGNLAEILDNLAGVVRERFKIRRQVRVHTAHGRFTGYVLMALPAFLAIALSFINPEHMQLLFEERIGQLMIVGIIVMQAAGFIWIKQIVKIEV